jgi:hypothetical protein
MKSKNIFVIPTTDKTILAQDVKSKEFGFVLKSDIPNSINLKFSDGEVYHRYLPEAYNNDLNCNPVNVFITSEEDIKDGDYFLMNNCIVRRCESVKNRFGGLIYDFKGGCHSKSVCKKILHTTDVNICRNSNDVKRLSLAWLESFIAIKTHSVKTEQKLLVDLLTEVNI